jgi:aminopeptidase YwaD
MITSDTRNPSRLGQLLCVFVIAIALALALPLSAQDSVLTRAKVFAKDLASPSMFGRGYQKEGHRIAADYIAAHFQNFGLYPPISPADPAKPYFQPIRVSINLIEGEQSLIIDGKTMKIGKDYIIHEASTRCKLENLKIKDIGYGLPEQFNIGLKGSAILFRSGLPENIEKDPELKKKYAATSSDDVKLDFAHKMKVAAVIVVKKKLTASLSQMPIDLPVVEVLEGSLPRKKSKKCSMTINTTFKTTQSQNVAAMVRGTTHPDSIIIVSAHYDHLGTQGEAIFYGGNDNASGTSMLLSMAEHYSLPQNRPAFTMLFIAFTGEEAGLIGSRQYVEKNPLYPLANTKFILNLDLMANGDEGIMAVCGLDYPADFAQLQAINSIVNAVPIVKGRPNAPNSDHYWFVKNGVKGMFIFTMGGPPHYHDVNDTFEEMRFSKYLEVRNLMIAFLNWQMTGK